MPRPHKSRPAGRSFWSTVLAVSIYDLLAAAVSMWLAVTIRYYYHENTADPGVVLRSVAVFTMACAIVFPLQSLHKGVWRYTALNDAVRIMRAVGLANLVFLPVLFLLNRLDGFPRTSILIEIPILIGLLLGARVIVAAWRTGGLPTAFRFEDRMKPAAIFVGNEADLDDALRDLARRNGSAPFRAKGLVVLDTPLAGRAIRGVQIIGGLEDIPAAINRLSAVEKLPPRLVLAGERIDIDTVNGLIRIASATGAKLSRARPGKGPGAFSPVETADLLNRPPRTPDLEPAREMIEGKRVLVTGAGGTIGSQLVRLSAQLSPEKLILLDASETNLYEIDLEMRRKGAGVNWRAVLADVRDPERLDTVFGEEKPHVVLHAAALKHVPMSELNPGEAVRTNVLGTSLTIGAARKHGAEVLALISTDKAVEPSNVMGTTKRAAELLAQAEAEQQNGMRICVVRFGNVLGSSGSVVPLFEHQIETGQSVTVTDPEATRYFMTVSEASGLVLSAASLTAADPERNGALYVFDMGEPVSILRLARQLLRLRGLDPDAPGAINVIGLRPGEKRHESLIYGFEETSSTEIGSIRCVNGGKIPSECSEGILADLLKSARLNDLEQMQASLEQIAALQPVVEAAKETALSH